MRQRRSQSVFFIGLASFTILIASTDTTEAKKPLKVFILSGQSNMQGQARVSTFDYLGDDPKTLPLLKEMRDDQGKPRFVKNTWISYLTRGRGREDGEGFGQLTAGYGARTNPAKNGGKIGPEFTFGITMQKSLHQPVLIIKTAWGGKSLHTDFRPPSAGPYDLNASEIQSLKKRGRNIEEEIAKRKKQSGVYYRLMIDYVNKILKDIKRVYPNYDENQGYEIAGFVWFQGWNDVVNSGVYPHRGQKGGYDKYSEWMAQFIRDVRKDLKTPKMPFVIGVLGVNGPLENLEPRYRKIHGTFREAMAAPASLPEFQGNVIAVRTAPFWDMPLDRIQKKYDKIGQRNRQLRNKVKKGELTRTEADAELKKFEASLVTREEIALRKRGASNAGYHYYGCAKTMALIGQAFADAIIKMENIGD